MSDFLWPAVVAIAVTCWVIGLILQLRASRTRIGNTPLILPSSYFAAVIVFLGLIGFGFLIVGILRFAAWDEVEPLLFSKVSHVTINGVASAQPNVVVTAIRQRDNGFFVGHHSHPTASFHIDMQTSNGPLALVLKRDSAYENEYWMYSEDFHRAYLGRVHISAMK